MNFEHFQYEATGNETLEVVKVFIAHTNATLTVLFIKELSCIVGVNGGLYLPADLKGEANLKLSGTLTAIPAYFTDEKARKVRIGHKSLGSIFMHEKPDAPYMDDWKETEINVVYDTDARSVLFASLNPSCCERFAESLRAATGRLANITQLHFWTDYPEYVPFLIGSKVTA